MKVFTDILFVHLLLLKISFTCSFIVSNVKKLNFPSRNIFDSGSKLNGLLDDVITGSKTFTVSDLKKKNESYLLELQKRVKRINAMENEMEELSDEELQAKTLEFRSRLAKGEDINGVILEESFAVVREASWRVLELRHYDVQLLGGMVLHDGRLAEMATGEGKTLVATLPCYLNALAGDSSFVITVNDYLARRDAEKMGQVHSFLGLSVGLIQSEMEVEERKKAYESDVIYVTNSELGFDYLRDNLSLSTRGTVLEEVNGFCVVDEADSVLIDEARTPLIISKQVDAPASQYKAANELANALKNNVHYTVDLKNQNIILNEKAYRDCERALSVDSLFTVNGVFGAWAPFISNAVKAKELFKKDVEYSVLLDSQKNKVGIGIIDSFTGRVLDGRRWSDGLHQSIETKEGIDVSTQSKVIAKITYQSLFRQFSRLSGMTGTAITDFEEFENVYGLRVTTVPTALPIARRDYPDVVYKTRQAANNALINEIVAVGGGDRDGRPCLVGTTSVAQSESLVQGLNERNIEAQLLNASPKNAARESEVVAQAGRAGVVTVATNMAGRGTDILLGGCSSTMARLKARSMLNPLLLNAEEMKKVPPNPSDSYYPCPLNESLEQQIKQVASTIQKTLKTEITVKQLNEIISQAADTTESEEDPLHLIQLRNALEEVQEEYKKITSEDKDAVINKGGLYVMGTNRHDSNRIDNQLRGRAGRQGDPGTSRFFLSFQDDMFVVFGGDGLKKILQTFRVSDDMPIEAPQVTDALDKCQAKVQETFEDIRMQILEFDLVLEEQRRIIYTKRQQVLFSSPQETLTIMKAYDNDLVRDLVEAQTTKNTVNVDVLFDKMIQFFPPITNVIQKQDFQNFSSSDMIKVLTLAVDELFNAKVEETEQTAKKSNSPPDSLARSANYIMLISIDNAWSDHLQNMENLKESVTLRKYQNLDPIAEYKEEALGMFTGLENTMRINACYSLWQSLK